MQHRHSYEVIRPYRVNNNDSDRNRNDHRNGKTEDGKDGLYSTAPFINNRSQSDCGLRMICKNIKCHCLQKCATINNFFFVSCLLVLFQSAVQETFLRIVVETNYYNISPDVIDWLILWEGGILVLFAMLIAYAGGRSHRPSWIAAFCTFQAILCFSLTVTTTTTFNYANKNSTDTSHSDLSLCEYGKYRETNPKWLSSWILFAILFTFQTASAWIKVSFGALGLTYVDDNVPSIHLPILIGIVAAMKYFGILFARFVMWFKNESNIYTSDNITWCFLGVPFLTLSVIIALFPYKYSCNQMNKPVRTTSATHKIERSSLYRIDQPGIFGRFHRIFSNKLILFTVLAIACVQTVVINCSALEYDYFKSVFFIDDYSDTSIINLIRLPVICMCVIFTGYVLYIVRPKASRILAANVIILCILIVLSFISMFLRCYELYLHNEVIQRKMLLEHCNQNCQCLSTQKFSPVCARGSSIIFYSPCHAGCREAYVDMEFWKCSCVSTQTVSAAYCKNESCESKVAFFQIIVLICISLIASTAVMNILLLIRMVNKRDRALIIGVQLTVSSILIYLPGKFFYSVIKYETCILLEPEGCKMNHGVQFSTYISLLNICFFMAACGLFSIAWYSIRNVNLFPKHEPDLQEELESLHYSNPNLVNGGRSLLSARSSSISAIPLSDHNPFKKDAIREFNEIQKQYSAKSEADLHSALRQNHFDGSKGITIRKDGILTTIL